MRMNFDSDDLKPLVEEIVAAVVERLDSRQRRLGERLAYTQPHAAQLLDVPQHVLRDLRLRGEIRGIKIGKKIVYEHGEILRFLNH